jgi:sensor histidine kinase YesM
MPGFIQKNTWIFHALFWVLVFGIWYFLRYEDYASAQTALLVTAIKVADLALLVYISNYLLLPRLLYTRRYMLFALAFLTMVVVSSLIKMQVLTWVQGQSFLAHSLKQRIYDHVIPHIFLVLAGVAIQLVLDYRKLQQRLAETAREKAEAELNFLKSQINPHFLFNSLNTVYFLIHKENELARRALHQFSEMLRYQLYETNGNKQPIEKELQFLRGYFELQKLRKDQELDIQFEIGEGLSGFSIEPLLLIPFIENAFKHVSRIPGRANFLKVYLGMEDQKLQLQVVNTHTGEKSSEPGGIGLQNVKRRLELLYPNRHSLQIKNGEDLFEVKLELFEFKV